jgi:competence protein ComEA
MTDPAFDWHALEVPTPAAPPPARAVRPSRLALIGAVIGLGVVTVAAGAYLVVSAPDPTLLIEGGGAAAFLPAGSRAPAAGQVVVDVEGAVVRPGLVALPAGSRVGDAIAAAGGFAASVDARASGSLNLAALATDGMQILVPERGSGSAGPADGGAADSTGAGAPLDLNQATAAELDALPGIGPATAAKILAARAESPFTGVDDLTARKLVGPATFQKIRDLVRVGG